MRKENTSINFYQCSSCGAHWESPSMTSSPSHAERCPNNFCSSNNVLGKLHNPYQVLDNSNRNHDNIDERIRY